MMSPDNRLQEAFAAFDAYNAADPHQEEANQQVFPKEVLYAKRMTERLAAFAPDAPEWLQLAARCQHIGRWQIPRESYAMDRRGYLRWRNRLKQHHANIAQQLLSDCGYDRDMIDKVKSLIQKKQLHQNPDTQVLEDVVCLVFVEHYLEAFAARHDDAKVVDILAKTMQKMSPRAIEAALRLPVSEPVTRLLDRAARDISGDS